MTDARALIDGVRTVLEEVSAALPDENVQDARELLEHSEWGEALSLICTQLFEYDVAISGSTYDRIELLGRQMGMPPKEWTMLKKLVEPAT